jgi:tripartite-type tricarboxylate transporter receptor subunit TctC
MKDDPTLTREFYIDPAFHCCPAGAPTDGDERSGYLQGRSSFIPHPSSFGRWIVAICIAMSAAVSMAQTYPSRPIRIIALSSSGSGPDIVGRLIGQKFTEAWGQQVIVDPRPAATGIIGTEIASRAAPDGHTLVVVTSQAVIVSVMYEKLSYDLIRDFSPISLIASTPFILIIHPSVPAASTSDLIAVAKAKPGQLRYGSGGSGSPPHLSAEIFKSMTGTDIVHVPYKGVTPALMDTVGGQVHMVFSVIPAAVSTVKSGKVRVLGVSSAKRTPLMPDLPTIAETVPGYEFIGWYSLFAPAKTPQPVIAKLNAEIVKALNTPDLQERFSNLGAEVSTSTPQELAAYLRVQTDKMRKAVKDSGARPD